jgi:hypothetical protein
MGPTADLDKAIKREASATAGKQTLAIKAVKLLY